MLYRLSSVIPVRMRSTYRVPPEHRQVHATHPIARVATMYEIPESLVYAEQWPRFRSTWWQWRGRVFAHRMTALAW